MRYLKPCGKIEIKKKWYDIVFTLDVIDELQDKAKMPMSEIMTLVTQKRTMKPTVECLLKYLLRQEIVIDENKIEYYSESLIGAYIEQIKRKKVQGEKAPEIVEEIKHEFIDIEYLFYYGTVELGYSEEEVWSMTLGKIGTLQVQHLKHKGWIIEEKEQSLLTI